MGSVPCDLTPGIDAPGAVRGAAGHTGRILHGR
jgi:hypothetical protein